MLRTPTLLRLGTTERAIFAFGSSVLWCIGRPLRERGNSDRENNSDHRGSEETVSDHVYLLTSGIGVFHN